MIALERKFTLLSETLDDMERVVGNNIYPNMYELGSISSILMF